MDARPLQLPDRDYPAKLRAWSEAPRTVWMRGAWEPAGRAVALVGARSASATALALASELAGELVSGGVDVVSGGALGVDGEAHRGALEVMQRGRTPGIGSTVVVSGCGVDRDYPERHAALFAAIVANGGAVLSQFAPGTAPRPGLFVRRNATIAGLCDLVVVVEAGARSGSLHTARAARRLGRRLACVPGSAGTDALLDEGALEVVGVADVWRALEGQGRAREQTTIGATAREVMDALGGDPRSPTEIAARTGLEVGAVIAQLMVLEDVALAARATGGRYVRRG